VTNQSTRLASPTVSELEQMHALYRQGGRDRNMAPHILYADPGCPHSGCGQKMQAIDFRLETYGPAGLVERYRVCRPVSRVRTVDSFHDSREARGCRRGGSDAPAIAQ